MHTMLVWITFVCSVVAADIASRDLSEKLDAVLQRMHALEQKDVVNQMRISALETELESFRSECLTQTVKQQRNVLPRAVAQTQVAFYAIAPNYDFSNMDANQNLIFASPFTNVGNSFNNSTGIFIAPVKGTYVFFITIGGNIHQFQYFYVDVNGTMMAKVFLGDTAQQSSQTVIATLRPGDAMSVKSGKDKDGAYGAYYTSIAGFLLYENIHTNPVG